MKNKSVRESAKERLMYEEIKGLFDGRYPSVRAFNEIVRPEELEYYRQIAYLCTLTEWNRINGLHHNFLRCLVKRDPQKYLDFLFENTILKELRYELHDSLLIMRFIEMIEKMHSERTYSRRQMLFSFLRSFLSSLNLNSSHEMIRRKNKEGEQDG